MDTFHGAAPRPRWIPAGRSLYKLNTLRRRRQANNEVIARSPVGIRGRAVAKPVATCRARSTRPRDDADACVREEARLALA